MSGRRVGAAQGGVGRLDGRERLRREFAATLADAAPPGPDAVG
ncbi:hypothetical protein ACIRFH_29620 [Streptomyces sp. NPDC093586]